MAVKNLKEHRGAYAIPMTPFTDDDCIDEQPLISEIEFFVENGADGICTPVLVSEFEQLTEDERKLMIRIPLEVNAGRLPVIANVAAQATNFSVELAEYARRYGADMLIAMQPYINQLSWERVIDHFRRIADVSDLPIMLQNAPFGSTAFSIDQVARLCEAVPQIKWVKQETLPAIPSVADLMDRQIPGFQGTMTGLAGLHLPYDIQLGATGLIHAGQFCDVISYLWKLFDGGESEHGNWLFNKFLRGIILELRHSQPFDKEIMVRRGIFKNHICRGWIAPLSREALAEIDEFWRLYTEEILPEIGSRKASRTSSYSM